MLCMSKGWCQNGDSWYNFMVLGTLFCLFGCLRDDLARGVSMPIIVSLFSFIQFSALCTLVLGPVCRGGACNALRFSSANGFVIKEKKFWAAATTRNGVEFE